MMNTAITQCGRIRANHPVREDFAGCTTGSVKGVGRTGYYMTKGHAINTFDDRLQIYGLCLNTDDLFDFPGDNGRKTIAIHNEFGRTVGYAILTWHRMEISGQYEFIGYLA